MVQQTRTQRTGNRFTRLAELFGSEPIRARVNRENDFLMQDFLEFSSLATNLTSHSRWIPYPFLVERVKKLSDEIRTLAEVVRVKVVELGGQISSDALRVPIAHDPENDTRELQDSGSYGYLKQNVGRLVRDMQTHSNLCDTLQHQKNIIGETDAANLISLMIADMQRQGKELLDIVMRIS